jgi:hypothetical protein
MLLGLNEENEDENDDATWWLLRAYYACRCLQGGLCLNWFVFLVDVGYTSVV